MTEALTQTPRNKPVECNSVAEKPSYELTWLEINKADFSRYGFLMRYREGNLSTNVPEISDFFDSNAWERSDPRVLFHISESILKTYFSAVIGESSFDRYLHEAVRSNFCNAIVSSMPKAGGRIPFEEITLWLEETAGS